MSHIDRFPREGDWVSCMCWCTRKILSVPIELIWKKQTESCGHPGCKPLDVGSTA